MKGYCEWCGRSPSLLERMRGDGLALNEDETLHLCRACRRGVPLAIAKRRTPRAPPLLGKYVSAVGVTAFLALFAVALLFRSAPPSAPRTGEVLGATQPGSSATAAPSRVVTKPSARVSEPATPRGSNAPNSGSPPAIDGGQGQAQGDPALSVGRAAIQTWKDSFGRSRLQVILSVRNDDARWVHFHGTRSTYRIMDGTREVASGAFTALAAVIGPGETAYLVDTINVPVVELTRRLSAESDVAALPTDPPAVTLSVTGLRLTSGIGGGMRATGLVHNDGGAATQPVIAGAIALDRDGRPLAAVYDTIDVGRVDPGEARPFATDYDPGAPPVIAESIGEVVSVAFEADF